MMFMPQEDLPHGTGVGIWVSVHPAGTPLRMKEHHVTVNMDERRRAGIHPPQGDPQTMSTERITTNPQGNTGPVAVRTGKGTGRRPRLWRRSQPFRWRASLTMLAGTPDQTGYGCGKFVPDRLDMVNSRYQVTIDQRKCKSIGKCMSLSLPSSTMQ